MSPATLSCLGSLLILLGSCWSSELAQGHTRFIDQMDNVMTVTTDSLADLINSPSLCLIFFCGKETPKIKAFLEAYNDAARYLKEYDVKLAVFDCMDEKETESACLREGIDKSVFTHRNGMALMSLEIEYLFYVDSIMANALQLVMLHEVPIIESRLERQELEQSLIGQRDLLLIHPRAVGTGDHRMFLEVAHAYQDRFSFALNIDHRSVLGLQDSEELTSGSGHGLWILFCSEATKEDVLRDGYCPHTMYRGRMTLFNLAAFVKKLAEKSVFNAPDDGVTSLFAMTSDDPILYVYIKPEEEQKNAAVMNSLTFDLRGSAKVVVVNMEDQDCQSAAQDQGFAGLCPSIGVKLKDRDMLFSDPEEWTVSGVRNFLSPYVFPEWESKQSSNDGQVAASDVTSAKDMKKDIESLIDDVETQDDPVASAVFSMRQKEMAGLDLVPGLLKDNFYRSIRRTPLLIVLFYEPFHHTSMAFLRDFGMAAQILAKNFSTSNVLARVNCFDGSDLCSAENITTYPTTRIYRQNPANHELYKGPLDALAVSKTAKLLQFKSPLQLTTKQEVDTFIKGHHPADFSKFTPSSVLLLATDSTSELVNAFKDVSVVMSQVTALAVVHPSLAPQIAEMYKTSVPSLVAHNREDKIKPIRTLALNGRDRTVLAMTAFIRAATIPIVPELSPENFPHLFARHQPMAILFVDSSHMETKEVSLASFSALAVSARFPPSTFCWMDAQVKSLGLKILSEYTWTAQLPMVSVVKHRQGQVFNFQPSSDSTELTDPIESDTLANWLDEVFTGKANPSKILEQGQWGPPGPYYNFLEFQQNRLDRGLFNPVSRVHDGVTYKEDSSYEDSTPDELEEEEKEEDIMETEVRKMLVELRNKHKLVQGAQQKDSYDEGISAQDSHNGHSHTEL